MKIVVLSGVMLIGNEIPMLSFGLSKAEYCK